MVRFPEHVQFRAPSGFSDAIDAAAKAKGERYGDFIREAVAERPQGALPTAGPMPTARPQPDQWAGMREVPQQVPQAVAPQQMAQAAPTRAAQGGPDPKVLLGILSNPWASPEQKQVASSLLEQGQQRAAAAEQRYYQQLNEADKRRYEDQVRQQGFQREDQRNGVTDRREDTRLGLEVSAADREARKPIEVGGVLVDPNTMRPVYQAPDKPTGSMQEYGAYATDERAAGRQPVGRLEYEQAVRKAGSNNTTISTGGGDNKQVFDAMAESSASARSATTGLNGLSEAKRALDAGIISGAGADWNLGLQKIGAAFGVVDPTIIQNTETFRASIAPQVAAVMKATVGSANISNSDREFAEKAAGGSINLDAGSIRRLVDIMDRASRTAIQSHVERLDAVYPPGGQFERERALFGVRMPEPLPDQEAGSGAGQQVPQMAPQMAAAPMPSAAPQMQAPPPASAGMPPARANGGRAYQGGVRPSAPAAPAQAAPAPGNYRWNPATNRMEPM